MGRRDRVAKRPRSHPALTHPLPFKRRDCNNICNIQAPNQRCPRIHSILAHHAYALSRAAVWTTTPSGNHEKSHNRLRSHESRAMAHGRLEDSYRARSVIHGDKPHRGSSAISPEDSDPVVSRQPEAGITFRLTNVALCIVYRNRYLTQSSASPLPPVSQ